MHSLDTTERAAVKILAGKTYEPQEKIAEQHA